MDHGEATSCGMPEAQLGVTRVFRKKTREECVPGEECPSPEQFWGHGGSGHDLESH